MRISASSRVRCATSIEKVLKMMNAPTNSAISAKVSRNVLKKPSPFLTSLACSVGHLLPVIASASAGSTGRIRSRSSFSPTPVSAATVISVNLPVRLSTCWAVGVSKKTSVSPAKDGLPSNSTTPTIVYVFSGWSVRTGAVSPSL